MTFFHNSRKRDSVGPQRRRIFVRFLSGGILISSLWVTLTLIPADRVGAEGPCIDEFTNTTYAECPPEELTAGKGLTRKQRSELLEQWNGLDKSVRDDYRKYLECKKQRQTASGDTSVQEEYDKAVYDLKRLLVAAVGRLALQTGLVLGDVTTDAQLMISKIKSTIEKDIADIKAGRYQGEMLAEFERQTKRATALRQMEEFYRKELERAISQLQKARATAQAKPPPTNGEKTAPMKPPEMEALKPPPADTMGRGVYQRLSDYPGAKGVTAADVGPDDLLYGVYNPDTYQPLPGQHPTNAVRGLQYHLDGKGKLLTDLQNPYGGSVRDFSKRAMDQTVKSGKKIFFDLTYMEDIAGSLNSPESKYYGGVTSEELRHIRSNWGSGYSNNVIFLRQVIDDTGKLKIIRVPAPW